MKIVFDVNRYLSDDLHGSAPQVCSHNLQKYNACRGSFRLCVVGRFVYDVLFDCLPCCCFFSMPVICLSFLFSVSFSIVSMPHLHTRVLFELPSNFSQFSMMLREF